MVSADKAYRASDHLFKLSPREALEASVMAHARAGRKWLLISESEYVLFGSELKLYGFEILNGIRGERYLYWGHAWQGTLTD